MAPYCFPFKFVIVVIVFLLKSPLALTNAEEKGAEISFLNPIKRATLQNMDLISILDDVTKTGCWIHLPENIMFNKKDKDQEIELAAQIQLGSTTKNQHSKFLIPVLLRDEERISDRKYENYLSAGLSPAARVKYSLCFINVFYWPLQFQDKNDKIIRTFELRVDQGKDQMQIRTKTGLFCSSYIYNGECLSFSSHAMMAKFTVGFLQMSERGNVVLEMESKGKHQEQEQGKRNFPQPFFSQFLMLDSTAAPYPFVAVTVQTSAPKPKPKSNSNSTAAQEGHRKMGMEITGVWFLNHWNILNGQVTAEPPCKNPRQTKSSKKTSCYSNVMSKNDNSRDQSSIPKPIESTWKFRFKTPADRFNPVNFTSTMESFLNSDVLNNTWKRVSYHEYWRSEPLNVHIQKNAPEYLFYEHLPLLWIWAGSKNYKFITSDSVFQIKSGLQIYTTPFQKQVWTLLFVSMVITVAVLLVLHLVKNPKETSKISSIWKILSELSLWILRILLEQPDQEIPPGIQIHQNLIKKGLKRAIRLILGVWLMMSLILVNGFRGIIKSDYTLDFPFASDPKWNSSMDFLKDGSFFVYYAEIDWECGGKSVQKSLFSLDVLLSSHKKPLCLKMRMLNRMNTVRDTCKSLCGHKYLFLPFEKSGCQKFKSCQTLYRNMILYSRQTVTCIQELPQLITSKLRHPKTVFMTTAQEFPFFWNQFKKQMKENSKLKMKFIHNAEEADEKVQEISGFSITFDDSKVNRNDADFILSPLKILLSSGIFWWWEKWEQIKFHRDRQIWRNSSEFIDESRAVFKPLSFQDSDIHLVFFIWLLFLIVPAAAFLFEIMSTSKILNRIWFICKKKSGRFDFPEKRENSKLFKMW